MTLLERNQNICITRPDETTVTIAEVDARIRQTDIVENAVQFFSRDLAANVSLNLVDGLGGLLNARPTANARV